MDTFIDVATAILTFLIPASLAILGSFCLAATVGLIVVDMPGGVNWSAIAGITAIVGGFGAVGGAGGWIGSHILSGQNTVSNWVTQYAHQLAGGGAILAVGALALGWAWKRASGPGVKAGGKGKAAKVKSLLLAAVLALIGATLAVAIPGIYSAVDTVLGNLHDFAASL